LSDARQEEVIKKQGRRTKIQKKPHADGLAAAV